MKILNIPKVIYLYNERIEDVNFNKLRNFIHQTFGRIKVCVVELKKKVISTKGLLFDFIATEDAFNKTDYSKVKNACHIILTPKLFATFDEQKKLHLRSSIFGYPWVISTSGIVEGPAKPKEYYLYKQKYIQLGIWDIEEAKIKKRFKGRFIDYQDKRLNEVLKGYIAQALLFYIAGEPFCKQRICRLYNAHWQSDLIYSQIKSGGFCEVHQSLLMRIKKAH